MVPPILKQPYFVPHRPGTSDTVRDADNGVVVEEIPPSVDPDDFAPKLVNATVSEWNSIRVHDREFFSAQLKA